MNDQIMLENSLSLTKSLIMLDINGVIESSNKKVKSVLSSILMVNLELQENLYEYMEYAGIYKTNNVKQSDINKIKKKLTGNN